MEIGKTLYVANRKSWRAWLRKNYNTQKEIWLIYYKKSSGKKRIPYNDSVEEALCYGWIDSTVKSIDADRFAQRFSPRKKTSSLSQSNIERIRKLILKKKMTRAGLRAIEHVFKPGKKEAKEKQAFPPAILKAIKQNADAWKHFNKLPLNYKRIRIAYIESRKKHGTEMYERALQHFINKTARNKRIGLIKA